MSNEITLRQGKLSVLKIAPASYVEPGRPRFPRNCPARGKAKFKKLCRLLEDRRTLTAGDEELITLYVTLWLRHSLALEHLESAGEIIDTIEGPRQNPWLAIAERCEQRMLSILERLGLSPASRDRVKVTRRKEEVDMFEIVLNPEKEGDTKCLPNGPTE